MDAIEAEASDMTGKEVREIAAKEAEAAAEADVTLTEPTGDDKKKVNPYIVFVGQLTFATTVDELLTHIRTTLHENPKIAGDCTIRLLTDERKKSKGMGFIQTSTPEHMYELLALHKTTLNGRRINVERTAGGGKNNDKRKIKLKQYKENQSNHMNETIGRILKEFYDSGDIKEGELDDGVVGLCGRHTTATVSQSLKEYVDMRGGRDKAGTLDNPSAYLTSIITRVSVEGVEASELERKKARESDKQKKQGGGGRGGGGRGGGGGGGRGGGGERSSPRKPPVVVAAKPPVDTGGIKLTMPAF